MNACSIQKVFLTLNTHMQRMALAYSDLTNCATYSTQEKIESATDILKAILKPVVDGAQEVSWPPRDPEALKLMEEVC